MYTEFNNVICVTGQALIRSQQNPEGVISKGGWDYWVSCEVVKVIRRGCYGKPALVAFDSLPTAPTNYQELVKKRFGNPQTEAKSNSLLEKIVITDEHRKVFKDYTYNDGQTLPLDHQTMYAATIATFDALTLLLKNTTTMRAALGKKVTNFWKQASEALNHIEAKVGFDLPKKPVPLQRKYERYLQEGAESVINGRFGNKNSEKIIGDILDWVTTEMANTRQSIDMVSLRYPQVAAEKGWRTDITAGAFRNRVSQPEVVQLINLKRHGRKGFRKLYGHTFKLKKSTYSNDIWVSDGTALNWYYNNNGKYALATTYMVMDECSGKILGYSTRAGINKENFEMQLEAYRMALRIAGTKPYQLLYDNQGGHKTATARNFYARLAQVHFPTRAYRPSGKAVERGFGKFQLMKLSEFPFWSGFGRESHSNIQYKPNMEAIQKNIDKLPTYTELIELLNVVVSEWNDLAYSTESPNTIYEANRNPEEQPVPLDDMMDMFFDMQGPKTYYPHGISLRLNGEDIMYEVYTEEGDVDFNFRRLHLKQKFYLKYDPSAEITEIGLYQMHATGGYQKVASANIKREAPRSVRYMNEGDKEWIMRQMQNEEQMLDAMDKVMADIGYDEDEKWSNWRLRMGTKPAPVAVAATLYGDSEGSMDVVN